jgi:hypothetical protein
LPDQRGTSYRPGGTIAGAPTSHCPPDAENHLTCVQHDLPVKIIVISNGTLGLIKWEQMVVLGSPEYGVNMARVIL